MGFYEGFRVLALFANEIDKKDILTLVMSSWENNGGKQRNYNLEKQKITLA